MESEFMAEALSKINWEAVLIIWLSIMFVYLLFVNRKIKRLLALTQISLGIYREIFGTPTDEQITIALLKIKEKQKDAKTDV